MTSNTVMLPAAAPDTATLYRRYADRVCRWATRLTRSPSDAEDIVQEVFMIVHRRGSSLQDVSSPSSWLLKVTLNVVRHHWRARGRSAKREESWNGREADAAALYPDPLQALEARRSLQRLQAAVDALNPRYRAVYVLCEIKRLPTVTVAEMTGLRPDTLRVRRHRARQQVANQLRRESEGKAIIDAIAA